jgi:uncharacterized protein (DUF427 family)
MANDHHAQIEPTEGRCQASLNGTLIASSEAALVLTESFAGKTLPRVVYFPEEDCRLRYFSSSGHTTFCPIKGDASYYHLTVDGNRQDNAAWYYADPLPAVEKIRNHVAFYSDRVDIERLTT